MKNMVSIEGSDIHYWVHNPKKTRTIVMIHGFTGTHEGFQYIVPLLGDFRLIIPDLPGFGESSIEKKDWSIEAIAHLANELVDYLDLDRPHIFGHSMGGLVVSAMLAERPDLYAKKAVLLSPVPTRVRRNDSRRVGAMLGALQYNVGYRVPKLGPRIVKSRRLSRTATRLIMTTKDRELKKAIHDHHIKNLDYISSIKFYHTLHRDISARGSIDYADSLRNFELLLVLGQKDNVAPLKEEFKLIKAVSPARVEIIPGVGHLAHYETPARVAEYVNSFLR